MKDVKDGPISRHSCGASERLRWMLSSCSRRTASEYVHSGRRTTAQPTAKRSRIRTASSDHDYTSCIIEKESCPEKGTEPASGSSVCQAVRKKDTAKQRPVYLKGDGDHDGAQQLKAQRDDGELVPALLPWNVQVPQLQARPFMSGGGLCLKKQGTFWWGTK
jgi:hypothetical protein